MGKYIKVFDNHSDYNQFIISGQAASPNVSYCVQEKEVHYNPEIFASEYFTTIALESGIISFNIWKSMGTEYITSISYSTDNGETWTTTNNTNGKTEHLVITVNVNEGDKVLWKGDAKQMGYYDEDEYGDTMGSFFSSTCRFDVQGNVMSLLYSDNFKGETTIESEYAFAYLFFDYNGENECKVVNARNLSLPATTLSQYCYDGMFQHCTSLITTPELPATTLANWCYVSMFHYCTSLTEAPELPAITLANGCYQGMFRYCSSLTNAPELPATTLASYCYDSMFLGCTSLTTAPTLPATTLAYDCYEYMFDGCINLTTAPELLATILTEGCYLNMFRGCISLTTAPKLPATTLVKMCYQGMFNGCTSLNSITCFATNISTINCTQDWVNGVSASGTFTKAASMNSWTTGNNGIPNGWTVETASN